MNIFIADLDGNIVKQLTNYDGYDAEATVSPTGDKIVFTSIRSGDLELYTCNIDGSDIRQVTNQLGYDGGAFFSHDGKKLVFRSSRPKTDEEIKHEEMKEMEEKIRKEQEDKLAKSAEDEEIEAEASGAASSDPEVGWRPTPRWEDEPWSAHDDVGGIHLANGAIQDRPRLRAQSAARLGLLLFSSKRIIMSARY